MSNFAIKYLCDGEVTTIESGFPDARSAHQRGQIVIDEINHDPTFDPTDTLMTYEVDEVIICPKCGDYTMKKEWVPAIIVGWHRCPKCHQGMEVQL